MGKINCKKCNDDKVEKEGPTELHTAVSNCKNLPPIEEVGDEKQSEDKEFKFIPYTEPPENNPREETQQTIEAVQSQVCQPKAQVPTQNSIVNSSTPIKSIIASNPHFIPALTKKTNDDGNRVPLEVIDENENNELSAREGCLLTTNRYVNYSHSSSLKQSRRVSNAISRSHTKKTITDIVSKRKLLSKSKNEILLRGNFNKYFIDEKKIKEAISVYLILSPFEIKIYRNKEHFLMGKTPLFLVPKTSISKVYKVAKNDEETKGVKNFLKYSFCIEVEETKDENEKPFKVQLAECFDKEIRRPKKISLISPTKKSGGSSRIEKEVAQESKKSLGENLSNTKMFFSSCNKEDILYWISALNYLISS